MKPIYIRHGTDLYEVRINEKFIIKSITRYCSESREGREVDFDNLPEQVKNKIQHEIETYDQ
jgi:hypothetical protein